MRTELIAFVEQTFGTLYIIETAPVVIGVGCLMLLENRAALNNQIKTSSPHKTGRRGTLYRGQRAQAIDEFCPQCIDRMLPHILAALVPASSLQRSQTTPLLCVVRGQVRLRDEHLALIHPQSCLLLEPCLPPGHASRDGETIPPGRLGCSHLRPLTSHKSVHLAYHVDCRSSNLAHHSSPRVIVSPICQSLLGVVPATLQTQPKQCVQRRPQRLHVESTQSTV